MTGLDNLRSEARATELDALDPERATRRYGHVIRRIARDERIRRRTAERRFVEMLKFLDVCSGSIAG
jgi:hypothetical protein